MLYALSEFWTVYINYGLHDPKTGKQFSHHDQLWMCEKGFVGGVLARKGSNTRIVRLIVCTLVSNGFVFSDKDPVFTGEKSKGGVQQELMSKPAMYGCSRPSIGSELVLWEDFQKKLSASSFASSTLNSPTCKDTQILAPSTMESGDDDVIIPERSPANTPKRKTANTSVQTAPGKAAPESKDTVRTPAHETAVRSQLKSRDTMIHTIKKQAAAILAQSKKEAEARFKAAKKQAAISLVETKRDAAAVLVATKKDAACALAATS